MALESRWLPSTFVEFPLPPLSFTTTAGALGITAGPDGNVWFTEPITGAIGRISPDGQVTEFPTPVHDPVAITTGPDGNLWFAGGQLGNGSIGRITPAGQVTEFTLPDIISAASGITAGPDGNLWFTENIYPNAERIGRITPTGQITEFTIPVPSGIFGTIGPITAGPGGNVWFTHDGILASISPTGALTDHVADGVGGVAAGPDGNLWTGGSVIDRQTGQDLGDFIERISPTGSVTRFDLGTTDSTPGSIQAGPDGNLWFTEPATDHIGRITPTGQTTLFSVPTAGSGPLVISPGPNGNLWFTEEFNRQIGEYFLVGTPPAVAAATTTTLAVDLSTATAGQTVHLTAAVTSAAGTPTGMVTFFDNNTAVGTANLDASGHAVLATAFQLSGPHNLVAVFDGTAAFAPSQSPQLRENVTPASNTITLTASANPATIGKQLVLTVTVTPALSGAEIPTGIVFLRDGTRTLGVATIDSSGHAEFKFVPGQVVGHGRARHTVLPRGIHHLTATYVGDGDFAQGTSARLDLRVV
jgi:streptogramin lyase